MFIRILPVFFDEANIREPVKRCPKHSLANDVSNLKFGFPSHLVRVDNNYCVYDEDKSSGRLSTRFPVITPHVDSDTVREQVKFMCLGSCVGGINRRPLKVIFTLETSQGVEVGRKAFDVRTCSYPRRDKNKEEGKNTQNEDNEVSSGQGSPGQLTRRTSKRKTNSLSSMFDNFGEDETDLDQVRSKKSRKVVNVNSPGPKCYFCKSPDYLSGPVKTEDSDEPLYYHNGCIQFFSNVSIKADIVRGIYSTKECKYCSQEGAVLKCLLCDDFAHIHCGKKMLWCFNKVDMTVLCHQHISDSD